MTTAEVACAIMVVAVVALGWWLHSRRQAGAWGQGLVAAQHAPLVPVITLTPAQSPAAASPPPSHMGPDSARQHLMAQWVGLGYGQWHAHDVPELPGMVLDVGHHANGTFVVVYEHPAAGVWFDLIAMHVGLASTTVSSSPTHDPKNTPPGDVLLNDRSLAPPQAQQLLSDQLIIQHRPAVDDVSPSSFAKVFCQAYRRNMRHVLTQDITAADVVRISKDLSGLPFSAAQVQATVALMDIKRQQALDTLLWAIAQEQGVASNKKTVLLHDMMSWDEAVSALEELWDEATVDIPPAVLSPSSVRALVDSAPGGLVFRIALEDLSSTPRFWVVERL